jgi:Putative DNA-binding domain
VNVPVALEEWSHDTIIELARLGRCEGERHDFKLNLPDADNLTKISCAFANSQGGFVILGVRDRSGHFLVEGIDPDGEIAKKFSDKIHAVPSVSFAGPRDIRVPGTSNLLYVFDVPRSSQRPHIPQPLDKRIFWKRTPGGCEPMSYEEIQEQFLRYEERRDKLKLLFIELLLNRDNLETMSAVSDGQYSLVTLDTGVLDRLVVDTYSVVQAEVRLIQILLTLRSDIRVINVRAQIFFSQMAQPLTGQEQLATAYRDFLKAKAGFLLPLIAEAIEILNTRFGFTDPFPAQAKNGAA